MKKSVLALLFIPFLFSCSNKGSSDEGFFKRFKDQIDNKEEEVTFLNLFDSISNLYSVDFYYDLHIGFSLKITEYDLLDYYYYPNEGVFSDDFESVTFQLSDRNDSELFPAGTYVLEHKLVNKADSFTLKVSNVTDNLTYNLTTTHKDAPIHIDINLVGTFDYKVNDETMFTIYSKVGSKADGFPSTITLNEGDKEFNASNYHFSNSEVTFDISGTSDGTYIKRTNNVSIKYSESSDSCKLILGNDNYPLVKRDEGPIGKEGFFYNNALRLSNEYFTMEMKSEVGTERRYYSISELDEGGRKNMVVLFRIYNQGETLRNDQGFNGYTIFSGVTSDTLEFRHRVENDADIVDVYRNNSLLYSNLTIEII